MKTDKEETTVIFRKFKEGDIIALFPEIAYRRNYTVLSYQHIGQHSDIDYNIVVSMTKLATEEEYKDLLKELESIGYKLKIRNRASINYKASI